MLELGAVDAAFLGRDDEARLGRVAKDLPAPALGLGGGQARVAAEQAAFEQKLDELTTMTNDLSNFLSSTMIGILFVDSHLNIRKFTEYIGREFQLESQDVGRSMQIFAHSFPDEDIVTDARNVLKDLTPVDREVVGMNGRFYTMRIAPYRTTENSIRGLVITVIDSLGSSNERTRESDHETSSPEGA